MCNGPSFYHRESNNAVNSGPWIEKRFALVPALPASQAGAHRHRALFLWAQPLRTSAPSCQLPFRLLPASQQCPGVARLLQTEQIEVPARGEEVALIG